MINFWAMDTVPARHRDRKLHVHNPNVTLDAHDGATRYRAYRRHPGSARGSMRMNGPVRFLLPQGGVSLIDAPGQPFS